MSIDLLNITLVVYVSLAPFPACLSVDSSDYFSFGFIIYFSNNFSGYQKCILFFLNHVRSNKDHNPDSGKIYTHA